MAERLEPGVVHEVLRAERPHDVQELVNVVSKRLDAPASDVVSFLRGMVRSGELKVKQPARSSVPGRLGAFLERHPLLAVLLRRYRTEPVIKAIAAIIVFNEISWLIIAAFQTSSALAPFRIVFHGVSLLFLPGFALTILWYPFPSEYLDFTKLDRRLKARDGRAAAGDTRARGLDPLARVAYSICYSVGLVILCGFLIGILGFGFNITMLHGLLTIIEFAVICVTVYKIQRIRDPYLNL
ncbi:MAG: DUF1616 domain-containing protein [Candidatus Lokiarchaeota archaeon]|nr:DUF1616 domain-containing protein [Candidatus Lokiarchaeota archaeon]